MARALPENTNIANDVKKLMQECVSEFILFITGEGPFIIATAFELNSANY